MGENDESHPVELEVWSAWRMIELLLVDLISNSIVRFKDVVVQCMELNVIEYDSGHQKVTLLKLE